jgi:hypothetical protein
VGSEMNNYGLSVADAVITSKLIQATKKKINGKLSLTKMEGFAGMYFFDGKNSLFHQISHKY